MAWTVEPQLFVSDMAQSLVFYVDDLGFAVGFVYGEPPFYAQVTRDGIAMNLRLVDGPAIDRSVGEELLSATITVDHAGRLFEDYRARGAPFHQPLMQEPWHEAGEGAFIVEDPDGNLILFSGPTD